MKCRRSHLLLRVSHMVSSRPPPVVDAELAEEIEVHRAMTQERLEQSGVPAVDAASASRRALGNVTLAREEARDIWTWPRLESVWRDVRVGARILRKFPGFTAIAVLTLALGIGANTAIFSAVQAVLLRPLPYADADRLAMLWTDDAKRGIHEAPTSSLLVGDWRRESRAFTDMAIFSTNSAILSGTDAPERTVTAFVSANLFSVLRVPATVGRAFSLDEEQRADYVAVVSYGLWQRRFGGSPDAIGKTIEIDGDANSNKKGPRTVRVVGVMPEGFYFPNKNIQVWEPATVYWRWKRESTERFLNDARRWGVAGRLAARATARDAQAEMCDDRPTSRPDVPGHRRRLSGLRRHGCSDARPCRRTAAPARAVGTAGGRGMSPPHCLRQRRQPSPRARRVAWARAGHQDRAWRGARTARPSAAGRKQPAGPRRRARRPVARVCRRAHPLGLSAPRHPAAGGDQRSMRRS